MSDLNKKAVEAKKNFIIYKDKIIKVQQETLKAYIGFDIISENPYTIKKNINAIELPEVVIRLISCKESRLRLANAICKNHKEIGNLLGISERVTFRMFSEYKMLSEEYLLLKRHKSKK